MPTPPHQPTRPLPFGQTKKPALGPVFRTPAAPSPVAARPRRADLVTVSRHRPERQHQGRAPQPAGTRRSAAKRPGPAPLPLPLPAGQRPPPLTISSTYRSRSPPHTPSPPSYPGVNHETTPLPGTSAIPSGPPGSAGTGPVVARRRRPALITGPGPARVLALVQFLSSSCLPAPALAGTLLAGAVSSWRARLLAYPGVSQLVGSLLVLWWVGARRPLCSVSASWENTMIS